MAESLVSTILGQLASLATEEVKLLASADKAVGKLTSNFQAIQAVLEDAESRQMKENSVADWLDKLKDVSYDIEDVLDEWITASKKLQAENASKLWKKVWFSGYWCGEPQRETCGTRVFGDGGESSKPLKVTLSGLAKHWTYAIPIGNGGLGAMVWGDVASETLQLNG